MNKSNTDQFCDELDALLKLPIDTPDQLAVWESSSMAFEKRMIENRIEIEDNDFHHIQHYLIDSDIRLKDKEYRTYQESLMHGISLKYRTSRAEQDGAGQPI